MFFRRVFPWFLVFFIVLIGAINAAAYYWHLYYLIRWFDIPVHLLGGIWVSLCCLWLRYGTVQGARLFPSEASPWPIALVVTFFVAISWEVFEFFVNKFVTADTYDILDTIGDVASGMVGAFLGAGFFIKKGYNEKAL